MVKKVQIKKVTVKKYALWNNKGGVGKTFLSFIIATEYAKKHPKSKVVVIDMCPQANISEILLGGSAKGGDDKLSKILSSDDDKTIGGYFRKRLDTREVMLATLHQYAIPVRTHLHTDHGLENDNLFLVVGNPSLELLVPVLNHAASSPDSPTAWKHVHSWLIDLQSGIIKNAESNRDFTEVVFFIDCNPSFAVYTAQALLATEKIIIPCTADGGSARAINNIAALLFGYKIAKKYKTVGFFSRVKKFKMKLPKIYLVIENGYTTSSNKPAKAFGTMFAKIEKKIAILINEHKEYFSEGYTCQKIPDAHTIAIVCASLALPFNAIKAKEYEINHKKPTVNSNALKAYSKAFKDLMKKI